MDIVEFEKLINKNNNFISMDWVASSASYDDISESVSLSEPDEEPDFVALEEILNNFPDLKYSTYKKISKLFVIEDTIECGYYGSVWCNRKKSLNLSDLKNVLIQDNYLQESLENFNIFRM